MTVSKKRDGTKLEVALEGRLDTNTSRQLEKELDPEMEGLTELIFDFADLQYISSAGLRILLSAQKIMDEQGSMTVRHVNNEIMDVFEITGFVDILTIDD